MGNRLRLARTGHDDRGASGSPLPGAKGAPFQQARAAPAIICRRCRHAITRPAEALEMNGAHRHTFANPHGIVFEIGCFRTAPGCTQVGAASGEFSWFSGYLWRVAICGGCMAHLGWRFEAPSGGLFYGLILDHLVFPA